MLDHLKNKDEWMRILRDNGKREFTGILVYVVDPDSVFPDEDNTELKALQRSAFVERLSYIPGALLFWPEEEK